MEAKRTEMEPTSPKMSEGLGRMATIRTPWEPWKEDQCTRMTSMVYLNTRIEVGELGTRRTKRSRMVVLRTPSFDLAIGRRIEDAHGACHRCPPYF